MTAANLKSSLSCCVALSLSQSRCSSIFSKASSVVDFLLGIKSVEDGDALEQGEMLGAGKAEIEQGEGLRLGDGQGRRGVDGVGERGVGWREVDGVGWREVDGVGERGVDGVGGRGDDDGLRDRGRGLPEVTVSDVPDAGLTGKLFDCSSSSMETTLYISLIKTNSNYIQVQKAQVVNIPNWYFPFILQPTSNWKIIEK